MSSIERRSDKKYYSEKEIKDVEKHLSKIYDEHARGAHIIYREKWIEYKEKN